MGILTNVPNKTWAITVGHILGEVVGCEGGVERDARGGKEELLEKTLEVFLKSKAGGSVINLVAAFIVKVTLDEH